MLEIKRQPGEMNFIRNRIWYKVHSTAYKLQAGVAAELSVIMDGPFQTGESFTLTLLNGQYSLVYTATPNPVVMAGEVPSYGGGDLNEYWNSVVVAFRASSRLSRYYRVDVGPAVSGKRTLKFTARFAGDLGNMSISNVTGVSGYFTDTQVYGKEPLYNESLKIVGDFYTPDEDGKLVKRHTLSATPDSNSDVIFEVQDLVRSYASAYLPSLTLAVPAVAESVMRGFLLRIAEQYLSSSPPDTNYTGYEFTDGGTPGVPLPLALLGGVSTHRFPTWDYDTHFGGGDGRRFLTRRPRRSFVYGSVPDYLFYYNRELGGTKLNLKVQVFYVDGSSKSYTAMSVSSPAGTKVYCFPISTTALDFGGNLDPAKEVAEWDVWVTLEGGSPVSSEKIRFMRTDLPADGARHFLFLNSLGGIDRFSSTGHWERGSDMSWVDVETYRFPDYSVSTAGLSRRDIQRTAHSTVQSGMLNAESMAWIEDLFSSESVWEIVNGQAVPVIIQNTGEYKYNSADILTSVSISVKNA